jgi:hypothetical protein
MEGILLAVAMRLGNSLRLGRVTLLVFVLGLGLALIVASVHEALFSTIVIWLFVGIAGWHLCASLQRNIDPKLDRLGYFWLVKLALTLFLLYVGWIPELDATSSAAAWGYDPQRYYQYSYDLVQNGWNPPAGLNYQGIIFYYGAIFYLFGHNPVIPAVINAFVTLLGTLYVIRVAYEFNRIRGPHNWILAYLLLIPEVLWYDVMTSRETLSSVLIAVAVLTAGRYMVRAYRVGFARTFIIVGISLAVLVAVRASMAIAVVACLAIMGLLLGRRRGLGFAANVVAGLGGVLLTAAPAVQQLMGGYEIKYSEMLRGIWSFQENIAAEAEWTEKSIGLLLAPDNLGQALLFLPLRMLAYLAAPLPRIAIPLGDLLDGRWAAWQGLMTSLTSVLNLLVFPYATAGFALAYRQRRAEPALLVVHLAFWVTFAAIAGGNIIIHERYRVMIAPLLYVSAWMGYVRCTRKQVLRFAIPWFGLLASAAVFYAGYKGL